VGEGRGAAAAAGARAHQGVGLEQRVGDAEDVGHVLVVRAQQRRDSLPRPANHNSRVIRLSLGLRCSSLRAQSNARDAAGFGVGS